MRYAEGMKRMEATQEKVVSGQEPLTTRDSRLTSFEPEILAFCCEH
jgi:hypothetical protein